MRKDKIAGALYGFAIGDSMGSTTEFLTKREIELKYGEINDLVGGGWLGLKAGECTDDTQMTLCVIDALLKHSDDKIMFMNECANNFVKWYEGNPPDVGNQCRKSISVGVNYFGKQDIGLIMTDAAYDEYGLGNGSLMRAMPCAILNALDLNIIQSRLTHNNRICDDLIGMYQKELQNVLCGVQIMRNVESLEKPTGCAINTLNNAFYWVKNTKSFKDAIIRPVNDGGDADTIAAITGSLAGAKYGFNNIPKAWVKKLDTNTKNQLDIFIDFVLKKYVQ